VQRAPSFSGLFEHLTEHRAQLVRAIGLSEIPEGNLPEAG
jgi:hypothetical protein